MKHIFDPTWPFILGGGSMYERLRRDPNITIDPSIFHAALIYGEENRDFLASITREYLDVGQASRLPMLWTTVTWRANAERIANSAFSARPVNRDAAEFALDVRASYGPDAAPIILGGCVGPKGDAYRPEEAPEREAARAFHAPQIEELANGNLDFLEAKTLPSSAEALGIADLMAEAGKPYILSFVVRPNGSILDGTPLAEVIDRIDSEIAQAPTHYMCNCVHPSIYRAAMATLPTELSKRVVGLEANTSAKSPEELDGLEEIDTQAPSDFGRELWRLHKSTGARYLGGCCGTSTEHIVELANHALPV